MHRLIHRLKHVSKVGKIEMTNCYVCPVCCKRSGVETVNCEMIIKRCEEHKDVLSTAEIYAKGLSVGNYYKAQAKL